ncbi:hypothetical protein [Methylobacterium sp. WSM2598]|nr:hypothetical protein [Methylobacterium sp. WSM2598]
MIPIVSSIRLGHIDGDEAQPHPLEVALEGKEEHAVSAQSVQLGDE